MAAGTPRVVSVWWLEEPGRSLVKASVLSGDGRLVGVGLRTTNRQGVCRLCVRLRKSELLRICRRSARPALREHGKAYEVTAADTFTMRDVPVIGPSTYTASQ